jgi:hypothetical protein
MKEKEVKPIKPEEILKKKLEVIPEEMIQAVNELIALNWNGSSSTIRQDKLLRKYFELSGLEDSRSNRDKVFDNHYLDFEQIYGENGWKIKFHAHDNSQDVIDIEPHYIFEVKKQ